MKFRIDFHGIVMEYERQPMSPERFKAICGLGIGVIGAFAFKAALAAAGGWAVAAIAILALFYIMVTNI